MENRKAELHKKNGHQLLTVAYKITHQLRHICVDHVTHCPQNA